MIEFINEVYKKYVKLTWPILISLHVTHGGFSSGTPKMKILYLVKKTTLLKERYITSIFLKEMKFECEITVEYQKCESLN